LVVAEHAVEIFCPATQSVQAWQAEATGMPEPVEYAPALQEVQVETTVAPNAVEYAPAPQRVHWPEAGRPEEELYVPAAQLAQVALDMAPRTEE
jgi:hypothetical protein